MTDALNRSILYSYDGVGNLLTVQNPKDSSVTYSVGYDAVNQRKSITYSDGITPNVSYQYDADGQRTQMVDGTGTTTYSYDSLHRLTQNTNGAGAQVLYKYDLLGHLTTLVYPGAMNAVNRTYDDAGRLASITDWFNYSTKLSYDANSNLISEAYPNGVTATFAYDAGNRIMQIVDSTAGSQLLNLTYGRDASNRLTGENSASYAYDVNNRVTVAATTASPVSYSYDAGDNLTIVNSANTTTNTYDAANQLQTATTMTGSTQVQKYTYGYDLNGNRISRTDKNNVITNYSWDQGNRLTNYGTTSYAYNGDGVRLTKTVNSIAEPFVWDVADGLPLILKDGSTSYVTGAGGLPLEQVNGSTILFFHQDQLGTGRALTSTSGTTVATYAFDPYGNPTATTGSVSNPFQYAGQYTDGESGLQYLRARYYDAVAGQFISRDPLLDETRQAYAYAHGDVLNGSDPSGLCDWWDGLCKAREAAASVAQALAGAADRAHSAAVGIGEMATGAATGAVGDAHDYLIDTQSDLLSGDPKRVSRGVLRSFVVAAVIIPFGRAAKAGVDAACSAGARIFSKLQREISFGKNFRIAPLGNKWKPPHYHRRPSSNPPPGQGIGRHRPWDVSPEDQSFWDRF